MQRLWHTAVTAVRFRFLLIGTYTDVLEHNIGYLHLQWHVIELHLRCLRIARDPDSYQLKNVSSKAVWHRFLPLSLHPFLPGTPCIRRALHKPSARTMLCICSPRPSTLAGFYRYLVPRIVLRNIFKLSIRGEQNGHDRYIHYLCLCRKTICCIGGVLSWITLCSVAGRISSPKSDNVSWSFTNLFLTEVLASKIQLEYVRNI